MKILLVVILFLALFLYVTMKSFEVSQKPAEKSPPLQEKSIRRFLDELNNQREVVRDNDGKQSNTATDHSKRHVFHYSKNILHPLILRRLAKRTRRQRQRQQDELRLNDEIFFGLEPEIKRNDEEPFFGRMLRLDAILNGGLYG
ncbi:hypothetical protein M3Y97_00008300 [Aphelenchoides bicaudatus]|nr:hypothetical protein M3Y97_00008300 [Aphelenchoides bicaudatus]